MSATSPASPPAPAPPPALALDGVTLRRDGRTILDAVTLSLAPGESVALVGPSGAGKSTLLRLVLGLDAPDRGTIHVDGALATRDARIVLAPEDRRLSVV